MEMDGRKTIRSDRQTVWQKLNDPEVLRQCIPGCTELSGSPEAGFEAVVVQRVGPVKATFKGAVQLLNVVPGQSYTLSGEGKGGVAGFAKGSADVTLTEGEEGTELAYAAQMQVGGKLAQLGNRIIGGFATRMADEFFERFVAVVERGESPAEDGQVAAT